MANKGSGAKWQLFIIIGMVVGVLVAGYLVFPQTEEERTALLSKIGTTNHGQLLMDPLTINTLQLESLQGGPWVFSEQKRKWRMLILGDDACIEECENMLYLSRQVHLLLGKKSHRFERVYVSSSKALEPELVSLIDQTHPYLKVVAVERARLEKWLENDGLKNMPDYGMALLVDQKGVVMMRYGPEHNGGGILEDITRLLKYSPGG